MRRPLNVFLPVAEAAADGVMQRFFDDPETWLDVGVRRSGPETWRLDVRGLGLTREVECHVGGPWRSGGGAWRRIEWMPVGSDRDVVPLERLLPRLEGELGVARQGGSCSLVLSGTYEVPAALVGAAVDAAGLSRVARHTATRFLATIRELLSAPAPAKL